MGLNRIIKNKPAVTNVEEWTKAEIGVGAAIAAGNQEENGKIADFVIVPNSRISKTITPISDLKITKDHL